MNKYPLLPDSPEATIVAWNSDKGAIPISKGQFMNAIYFIAHQLPPVSAVLNLCNDRYLFAVGLFAAISRGIVSILPQSIASEHLKSLYEEIPSLACLGDQATSPTGLGTYLRIQDHDFPAGSFRGIMPDVNADQIVTCQFTSGSTGKPQPHQKSFGNLRQGALAEAARLRSLTNNPLTIVGTVPFQHTFGFESTVLLPIFGGGQFTRTRPFFPADVVDALEAVPAPRLLVTTPFHLRNLLDAGLAFPPMVGVSTATAPLSVELAARAERAMNAPLLEVYGSTETGRLATREPTQTTLWQTYPGITLSQRDGTTLAEGGHLSAQQVLVDVVELVSPTQFRLLGRNSDMVNVAGKRNSLALLNQTISQITGVEDAAFFLPEGDPAVGRLAAFVVAPDLTSRQILDALRQHIDPCFLPRPLIFVEALPRNATGKLTANALATLLAQHGKRVPPHDKATTLD
jgi:acyl-coenzyme A synthetase/AMP-(fatty) acid ligase